MKKARCFGFALVVVLLALLLCSGLILVIIERETTSQRAASTYNQAARVRTLGDSVLAKLKAQIWEATTWNQEVDTPINQRATWASQPGAIRVYPPGGQNPVVYKLYSASEMIGAPASINDDVPADWHMRPQEYVDLNEPTGEGGALTYPILDPSLSSLPGSVGLNNPAGFSIQGAPVAGSGANPAPMPVRWLYFLRDGSLCLLGDSRIDAVNNPIVGRVAFWTDDETTKVNLNTAGPATVESFWDLPRAASRIEEERYSWFQPSQNEFTRYPGHPAMVSLRAVLGTLGNTDPQNYAELSPRYRWGGSQDGTVRIDSSRVSLDVLKEDRPYATTDEFLFESIGRGLRNFNGALSPASMSRLSFFLTTGSRAPELNLFGQPRVSIWPIHAQNSPNRRTPFDQLIAQASTLGGKPFYFVREFPLSSTRDFLDFPRNQQLYEYLQRASSSPFPGFGTRSFLEKYGDDRDQILTSIFDYIRCTNLNDTYRPATGDGAIQSYTPDIEVAVNAAAFHTATSPDKGAGFVVPIRIGDTQGGGRFPAVTGAALWFASHLENPRLPQGPTNRRMLSALLLVKTVTPMFGFPPWKPSGLQVQLANASDPPLRFEVDGVSATMFAGGTSGEYFAPPTANFGQGGGTSGGYDGAGWLLYHTDIPLNSPFLGASLVIPDTATSFDIQAGSFDVRMIINGTTVQSYRFSVPNATALPLPAMFTAVDDDFANPISWWKARSKFRPLAPFDTDSLRSIELSHGDARLALMQTTDPERPFDVFRPHPAFSDPSTRWAHSFGGVSVANNPYLWPGGNSGSYAGLSHFTEPVDTSGEGWRSPYRTMTRFFGPNILPDITSLRARGWSGDFDNGFSRWTDGPFLNMPDAGARSTSAGAAQAPYLITEGWKRADGLFSPLRQVPSAVMFGSLPTGVKAGIPWRTLLFCPNPSDPNHIGFQSPADHLLLDLFRMPVVEPVAMSGPAATDGKINMNYSIAPFSYIRRASSWFALLDPIRLFSVPDSKSERYKNARFIESFDYRVRVNVPETLRQFDERFSSGDIFRSATEICRLFLVPQSTGTTLASTRDLAGGWWSTRRLTGDNSREKPYAELYSKITTQSNTYRIHLRVQSLPPSGSPPLSGDFEPLAEYRGSAFLERYLNPNDPRFETVDPDQDCLNTLYRFRVLERRQFIP